MEESKENPSTPIPQPVQEAAEKQVTEPKRDNDAATLKVQPAPKKKRRQRKKSGAASGAVTPVEKTQSHSKQAKARGRSPSRATPRASNSSKPRTTRSPAVAGGIDSTRDSRSRKSRQRKRRSTTTSPSRSPPPTAKDGERFERRLRDLERLAKARLRGEETPFEELSDAEEEDRMSIDLPGGVTVFLPRGTSVAEGMAALARVTAAAGTPPAAPMAAAAPALPPSTTPAPGKEKEKEKEKEEAPAPPPFVDFETAAYALVASVPDNHLADKRIRYLAEKGVTGVKSTKRTTTQSPHFLAALARKIATIHGLVRLYKTGCRKVFLAWGSVRDVKLLDKINARVDPMHRMQYILHQEVREARDITRIDPRSRTKWVDDSDGVTGSLMCNIYWVGENEPLTPRWVARKLAQFGPVVLIMHDYRELYGMVEGESVWHRIESDDGSAMIVSKSDDTSAVYPPNPPCDWVHTDGYAQGESGRWLVWAPAENISDTRITMCAIQDSRPPAAGQPSFQETRRFCWRDLPASAPESYWLAFLRPLYKSRAVLEMMGTRKVLVDTQLIRRLRDDLGGKSHTAFTFRSLLNQASLLARDDPLYEKIAKTFPEHAEDQFSQLPYNCASVVFRMAARQGARHMDSYLTDAGEDFTTINSNIQLIGATKPPSGGAKFSWWWVAGGLAVCGTVGYALYRLSQRQDVVVAPPKIDTGVGRVADLVKPGAVILGRSTEPINKAFFTCVDGCKAVLATIQRPVLGAVRVLQHVGSELKTVAQMARSGATYLYEVRRLGPPRLYPHVWGEMTFWPTLLTVSTFPILEELFKRQNPYCLHGLIWFEFAKRMVACEEPAEIPGAVLVVALHYYWASLPLHRAVLSHSGYNIGVICFQEFVWSLKLFTELFNASVRDGIDFDDVMSLCRNAPDRALENLWTTSVTAQTLVPGMLLAGHTPPTQTVSLDSVPWIMFKEQYYELPWGLRGGWDGFSVRTSAFQPLEGLVKKQVTSHFTAKPKDTEMRVRNTIEADVDPQTSQYVYWYLPTCVPGYSPARTNNNLLAVYEARLLVDPPMHPDDQQVNWERLEWSAVDARYRGSPIDRDDHIEEWLANITEGWKKKRALDAEKRVVNMEVSYRDPRLARCQVMTKTDELLMKGDEFAVQMKPRAIVNVDPVFQVLAGPEVFEATRRIKEMWPWDLSSPTQLYLLRCSEEQRNAACKNGIPRGENRWNSYPWKLHVTFGSAATDTLLSDWMAQVLTLPVGHAAILVAGDDSLVACVTEDGIVFIEADASSYDQSQSKGPLNHQLSCLQRLGMSGRATAILRITYRAPYYSYAVKGAGKIVVKHEHRPMRTTGGPDTTIGNTIDMAEAWTNVLYYFSPSRESSGISYIEVVYEFRRLGLDMKVKMFEDPTAVTFLKGMWYPTAKGLRWGPLPSRILKLGKTLVDPRRIYPKGKLSGDTPSERYASAIRLFASDLALSYKSFEVRVPFLDEFCERFCVYEASQGANTRALIEPWGVQPGAAAGERERLAVTDMTSVYQRYLLEPADIEEMSAQIANAPLFTFLEHPGYLALARVDYN